MSFSREIAEAREGGRKSEESEGLHTVAHRERTKKGEGEGRVVVGPAACVPAAGTTRRTMLACPQPP
jgi:hypothetical protein